MKFHVYPDSSLTKDEFTAGSELDTMATRRDADAKLTVKLAPAKAGKSAVKLVTKSGTEIGVRAFDFSPTGKKYAAMRDTYVIHALAAPAVTIPPNTYVTLDAMFKAMKRSLSLSASYFNAALKGSLKSLGPVTVSWR